MPTVDETIEVNAPVSRVYDAWTNFERFPQFMEHVKEVRQIGQDETHWVAEIGGRTVEWNARTTVKEENRRVAWQATGESGQSGSVTFEQIAPDRTTLHVHFDYKLPSRTQEVAASATGLDERAVKEDLERFKDLIEGRQVS